MAGFYAARDNTMPPLPWPSIAPPFTAILKRQAKARITQLNSQLSQVDESINTLLQSNPETSRALDIICSIPGLSKISAAALLIEMPELGTLKEKQVASLAGLVRIPGTSAR